MNCFMNLADLQKNPKQTKKNPSCSINKWGGWDWFSAVLYKKCLIYYHSASVLELFVAVCALWKRVLNTSASYDWSMWLHIALSSHKPQGILLRVLHFDVPLWELTNILLTAKLPQLPLLVRARSTVHLSLLKGRHVYITSTCWLWWSTEYCGEHCRFCVCTNPNCILLPCWWLQIWFYGK